LATISVPAGIVFAAIWSFQDAVELAHAAAFFRGGEPELAATIRQSAAISTF
jgi:hypothetical protein